MNCSSTAFQHRFSYCCQVDQLIEHMLWRFRAWSNSSYYNWDNLMVIWLRWLCIWLFSIRRTVSFKDMTGQLVSGRKFDLKYFMIVFKYFIWNSKQDLPASQYFVKLNIYHPYFRKNFPHWFPIFNPRIFCRHRFFVCIFHSL